MTKLVKAPAVMAVKPPPEAPNSPAFAKSFGDNVKANGGPCVDSGFEVDFVVCRDVGCRV